MPRIDAAPNQHLLLRVLQQPAEMSSLSAVELSAIIDAATQARLLGWLVDELDRLGVRTKSPEWLRDRLIAARALTKEYEREIRWEIDRIDRAFADADFPWMLLKGAAYLAASLPTGSGRRVADIDILVPQDAVARAERLLNRQGWHVGELAPYDERYYREWMHELPPMTHDVRRSTVDLHHAILPRTSRLQPPTARLIDRAVCVEGGLHVLCPSHMVLHAAAHLFHDGEVAGAIRDLVDLHLLLQHFSADASFWTDFVQEAPALGLARPAYYAVRYAQRFFHTPVPTAAAEHIDAWGPPRMVTALMDRTVERALPGTNRRGSGSATFALYVRSHWLRMPPLMLARHLTTQAVRRHRPDRS